MSNNRYWRSVLWLPLVVVAAVAPAAEGRSFVGLDHIPIAVGDLDAAVSRYRALGFAVKAGRIHRNGIRNAHVKFPDGAGVELLTATDAADALSKRYVEHLSRGDGPRFLSFHARDTNRLRTSLRSGNFGFRISGQLTELTDTDLEFIFMIRDNRASSDTPAHFAHRNGAAKVRAFWVATAQPEGLLRLLVRLGGTHQQRQVYAPQSTHATVVFLEEQELYVLPHSSQVVDGRPIVGVSFEVTNLKLTREALRRGSIEPWSGTVGKDRIVVDPGQTHGLWLEFRGD